MLAKTPTPYMSLGPGSSTFDSFWATRTRPFSFSTARSRALTDFSRPTKSGQIMLGNTTVSRRGRIG